MEMLLASEQHMAMGEGIVRTSAMTAFADDALHGSLLDRCIFESTCVQWPSPSLVRAPSPDWLEAVNKLHRSHVEPLLRSLLSSRTLANFANVEEPNQPQSSVYEAVYHKLLILSTMNNFSGDRILLPKHNVMTTMRYRHKELFQHTAPLSQFAREAFAEKMFWCAIEESNKEIVNYLLSAAQLNIDTSSIKHGLRRLSPLELSVYLGDYDMIRLLIHHKVNISEPNDRIWQLLGDAIRGAFDDVVRRVIEQDIVRVLLKAGLMIGKEDCLDTMCLFSNAPVTETLMEHLIQSSATHTTIVSVFLKGMKFLSDATATCWAKELVRSGIDIDILNNEDSPRALLDDAVSLRYLETVDTLIVAQARPTSATLAHAIRADNTSLTRCLLNVDVAYRKVDGDQGFPVIEVTQTRNTPMMKWAMKHRETVTVARWKVFKKSLQAAAELGNVKILQYLLELRRDGGSDVIEQDSDVYDAEEQRARDLGKALERAVQNNQMKAARMLIAAGADVNRQRRKCVHPLVFAVCTHNLELVYALLDAGADATQASGVLTPAVRWGEIPVIQDLILAGARVDKGFYPTPIFDDRSFENGRYPLVAAIRKRCPRIIHLLLDAGAGASYYNSYPSALTEAVKTADLALVCLLLEHGADVNDNEALEQAVLTGVEMLQMLLQKHKQCYPSGKKWFGTLALRAAFNMERIDIVQLLLRYKLDLHAYARDHSSSSDLNAFGFAIKADKSVRTGAVRMLLAHGVDSESCVKRISMLTPGSPIIYSTTALVAAIEAQDLEVVQLLIDCGADVNRAALSTFRQTPVQGAAETGNLDLVQFLLDRGADPNGLPAAQGGGTALQFAAIGGYNGIIELLIQHGADVNGPRSRVYGRSAIEAAAEHGRINTVEFLYQHGARIETPTHRKAPTAIDLAKHNGHMAVARMLQGYIRNETQLPFLPKPTARPVCPECHQDFKNQSSLTRHRNCRHGHGPQLPCPNCDETFPRQDVLKRHMDTHTKEGYIPCPNCNKSFRKDYMKKHLTSQCGGNGPSEGVEE